MPIISIWLTIPIIIISLSIGFYLLINVNRKRFNRTNVAGIEQFKSYGNSIITRFVEWFLESLAALFLLIGFLSIAYILYMTFINK